MPIPDGQPMTLKSPGKHHSTFRNKTYYSCLCDSNTKHFKNHMQNKLKTKARISLSLKTFPESLNSLMKALVFNVIVEVYYEYFL